MLATVYSGLTAIMDDTVAASSITPAKRDPLDDTCILPRVRNDVLLYLCIFLIVRHMIYTEREKMCWGEGG